MGRLIRAALVVAVLAASVPAHAGLWDFIKRNVPWVV